MTTPLTKVFTLLSGGIDSSTTLAMAIHEWPEAPVECVTFDYGQRHINEAAAAACVAKYYEVSHTILDIKGLLQGMLVDKPKNEEIPNASYSDLPAGISPTYVSFRNGVMLSLLAARAQAWVMAMEKLRDAGHRIMCDETYEAVLYCGVHADDGVNWAYPDCTPEFIGPLGSAIYVGTYQKVRLRTPLLFMTKASVVKEGLDHLVPYHLTWSCYKGNKLHCGTCPTCRSRKEAFVMNQKMDPTEYEDAS